jgi:aspartate aminotransferase-like enzyme
MLENETYARVFERHAACADAARVGLTALGFQLFADPHHASQTVTAAYVPAGIEWAALNKAMKARGLVLAGGQDDLAGKIMRIGHLGEVTVDDVIAAIQIIGEAAAELGMATDPARGVDAARAAAHATRVDAREPVAAGA